MSLVGTRPPTVDEWEQYELHHRSRMSIKPGITGMWQASGRSDITDFEEVVKLDTEYIENKWFEFGKDEDGNELPKTVISREFSSEWKTGDGMTYKEDVAAVKESFSKMLENGTYKGDLFSDL